jgi:hypothetical protein
MGSMDNLIDNAKLQTDMTSIWPLSAIMILASSSISYLTAAQLKGSLFQSDCESGAVSSVFTSFYVDHDEPSEVLKQCEAKGQWGLGDSSMDMNFLLFSLLALEPN